MPTKNHNRRTAAEQLFWDEAFQLAFAHALRQDGKRSDVNRINWAAARADGALAARRRSVTEGAAIVQRRRVQGKQS